MNRYHLVHVTEFRYDGPVSESYNEVRLRPIHDERQSCLSFRLTTNPTSRSTAYRDFYGNWVHQFNILPEHRHLRIEAEAVVLAHDSVLPPSDGIRARRDSISGAHNLLEDNFDFVAPRPTFPIFLSFRRSPKRRRMPATRQSVASRKPRRRSIHERFRYVKGATHVHSSIADSLALGVGVCQDFAHLLLGVVRLQGFRLATFPVISFRVAAAAETKQEEVIGGQASHAWVEVFSPKRRWIAFDPTLGKPVGLRHVRVAYGRDYGDVAPVRGVYKGHAGQRLSVDVRVRPVLDDEGREQMTKDAAVPNTPQPVSSRPHQQSQQQQ